MLFTHDTSRYAGDSMVLTYPNQVCFTNRHFLRDWSAGSRGMGLRLIPFEKYRHGRR